MAKIWVTLIIGVVVVALFGLACSGSISEDDTEEGSPQIGIAILSGECSEYVGKTNISEKLGSLAIQFYDESGKLVQVNGKNAVSFSKEDLSNEIKITGIPPMTGARVVFSGFEEGNTSTPKWRGEVRDVTFEKKKETKVQTVLYPIEGKGCFPNPLVTSRFGHAAALLPDGRILVTGGFTSRENTRWKATLDVELLDPETGTVDRIADMKNPRAFHHMVVLPDGRVLIAGGVRDMEVTPMTVDGYPDLPMTLSIPMNGVELYTVDLPKRNQRPRDENGDVITNDQSTAVYLGNTEEMDFAMIYQSYAYVMSNPETGSGTLFMVGGVRDGVAQSKIWGAEVTVNGAEVAVTVNEYHSDKSETFVMPVVAPAGLDEFGNPRVLVIGGRKASASQFATMITKSAYTDWPHTAPNLFGASFAVNGTDGTIVVAGGMVLAAGGSEFSLSGDAYLFDPTNVAQRNGPLYWGRWLGDVVLNAADGYLVSICGFNEFKENGEGKIAGTTFYEYAPLDTLSFNPYQKWSDTAVPRGAHRLVVASGDPDMTYIIGGIQDLLGDSDSSLIGLIEILPMRNPF